MHKAGAFFLICTWLFLLPVAAGSQAPQYLCQWGTQGSGDGQFRLPLGVAVDASGNVYVTDYECYRIQKFTNSGSYLAQWGCYQANGVAVSSDGKVYVTVPGFGVEVFTTSGTPLNTFGYFGYPNGVAVDTSGNVYVTDYDYYWIPIQKYTGDGVYITQWGGVWWTAQGVAVDAGGNVYVADDCNGLIVKYTDDGTYLTHWGTSGSGDGQFYGPCGVAVDASGNVYVADIYNDRIQKFTSDGVYLTQWGTTGSGDGQFNGPRGVAVDDSGKVYVADAGNFRIQVFGYAPTGLPGAMPTVLRLYPSQPNPFNPTTTIKYDVPGDGRVTLRIYDVRGAMVRTLVDTGLPHGSHQATWDGRDASGRGMASGSYFARLEAGGRVETVRMSLVR